MWVRSGGGAVDKSGQWTACGYLLSTGLCIELSTGGVDNSIHRVINRGCGYLLSQVINRVWTVTNLYTSSIVLTQCYTMLQLIYRLRGCLSTALV